MVNDAELDAIAREIAAARRDARLLPTVSLCDRTVVRLADVDGTCSLGRFVAPKLEPEIVLHLHRAPPPGAAAHELLACIDWVAQGFEVVQCHFPDWTFQAADTVADATLHAMLLLGDPVPLGEAAGGADAAAALRDLTLALSCDGRVREVGRGANVLGSPLLALAHLSDLLTRQPGAPALAAGELVTTGSTTMAYAVRPGERWSTRVAGLGVPDIAVRFTA
jgi:2-oxo-3-hexenedioate decarboxylase